MEGAAHRCLQTRISVSPACAGAAGSGGAVETRLESGGCRALPQYQERTACTVGLQAKPFERAGAAKGQVVVLLRLGARHVVQILYQARDGRVPSV
jgi:hypothetical protein